MCCVECYVSIQVVSHIDRKSMSRPHSGVACLAARVQPTLSRPRPRPQTSVHQTAPVYSVYLLEPESPQSPTRQSKTSDGQIKGRDGLSSRSRASGDAESGSSMRNGRHYAGSHQGSPAVAAGRFRTAAIA